MKKKKNILQNKSFKMPMSMSDDELEKYLRSLILCTKYYYPYGFFLDYYRTNNSFFEQEMVKYKILVYEEYMYAPVKCKKFAKAKSIVTNLNDMSTYIEITPDIGEWNYLLNTLTDVLDEYIIKNKLPYVKVTYVMAEHHGIFGMGSIFIHTKTEIFCLRINSD